MDFPVWNVETKRRPRYVERILAPMQLTILDPLLMLKTYPVCLNPVFL